MEQPYQQPQGALLNSIQQNSDVPVYSLFDPAYYPKSVAFWHNPSPLPPLAIPALSYPFMQSTLLQPISDQKKHKRTRSGCFTCRTRRIKCDETRPVCERCRKGSRDCVYPSSTSASSKTAARTSAKLRSAHPPSQEGDSASTFETESSSPLEPIIDEDDNNIVELESRPSPTSSMNASPKDLKETQSGQSLSKPNTKTVFEADPFNLVSSRSPSAETLSVPSASIGHSTPELLSSACLPDDLRFYLNFYQQFISHDHFFLRRNSTRFVQHTIIELALLYEPLLYALVGFSAYHHTLRTPGGKLYTFLKYYHKALTLLRKSLGSGEEHTEATLCTVLVLATFEVSFYLDHLFATRSLVRFSLSIF